MALAHQLLLTGVNYYFPDGKVGFYDLVKIERELEAMSNATAEDYAFYFFVTFVPPIIRRLYPERAESYHQLKLVPLLAKVFSQRK